MNGKILVPSSLTRESNAVFPWAVTIAQAFPERLYLLHVMDPDSINKPERLEDFPNLGEFFGRDHDVHFTPPLKATVPISKSYIYNKEPAKVILGMAKAKNVDLICMSAIRAGANFLWWSAGKVVETVVEKAHCSVLCVRGRDLRENQWERPQFRHLLLLTELNKDGAVPLTKVMPWVQRFNSLLHVFPLGDLKEAVEQEKLRDLCYNEQVRTNVLMFDRPNQRAENLLRFITDTPVDLIIMTPRMRVRFNNRMFSDIFVRLLRVTDVPILLLR